MNTWLRISVFIVILSITLANDEEIDDKLKTFPKKLLARRREVSHDIKIIKARIFIDSITSRNISVYLK
jgi:hypothetical protein